MPRSTRIDASINHHRFSRSPRTRLIAQWFNLNPADAIAPASPPALLASWLPSPGQIVLITGASGSGKSTLLRQAACELQNRDAPVIDLANLVLPDLPVVDCLGGLSIEAALLLLGRMGLGEAWTYLRTPGELSDGQRWRLRLAMALHEAMTQPDPSAVLICDEFSALLDRVTACIVARGIRRLIDLYPRLSAILATGHGDIRNALSPDRVIHCDFGRFELLG